MNIGAQVSKESWTKLDIELAFSCRGRRRRCCTTGRLDRGHSVSVSFQSAVETIYYRPNSWINRLRIVRATEEVSAEEATASDNLCKERIACGRRLCSRLFVFLHRLIYLNPSINSIVHACTCQASVREEKRDFV